MDNNVSQALRNEWKYPISLNEWLVLEEKLKQILSPDRHAGTDNKYKVHSLYFDDFHNSCMSDNDAGNGRRKKFRIRYYQDNPEVLRLECKEKNEAGRCRKLSCNISAQQYEKLIAGRAAELLSETEDPLLKRFCLCFIHGAFKPAAIIDYERTAYVEEVANIRVTFDEHISVSDQFTEFLTGDYVKNPLSNADSVLEVKFDYVLPGYLTRLLSGGSLQVSSFSKYYLGRLLQRSAL
ncbi:MAG: polyphosphate polymerase domain-containing protein [Lachnospiraceae bacterium]|nr:polyphosphate polymerase domain-containing protein [Lachnospiraceae bacterium]